MAHKKKQYPSLIENRVYQGIAWNWKHIGSGPYQAQFKDGKPSLIGCLPAFGDYQWVINLPEMSDNLVCELSLKNGKIQHSYNYK